MGSALELDFRISGAGWADLRISKGGQRHEIDGISYLTDALDDLLRLGVAMATDSICDWTQFAHEPGSTVLLAENGFLKQADPMTRCRLSVISWPGSGRHEPTWSGLQEAGREFILDLESRDELPGAILAAADRLKEDLGIEGYSKQWSGRLGFPSRAVAALRAALATPSVSKENRGG
ncbi:MAG: hypothetical protein QOJ91_1822 [Sphingomonadales bacterium]|nr:hypothetical protein [Sphingomonadales bacterium]